MIRDNGKTALMGAQTSFNKERMEKHMSKIIMGIELEKRNDTAASVQDILTEFGCYIQTRIGLHQTATNACSEKGLIILELTDDADGKAAGLEESLKKIPGVRIQKMEF
jgi:hypothetical protein